MIIVKLFGGLGNQMFQYAAAKSLATDTGAILKLDTSSFYKHVPNETPRNWALEIFPNITDGFSNAAEIKALMPDFQRPVFNRAYKFAVKKMGWLNRNYLADQSFNYTPLTLKSNQIYMDGYWQSYKYFAKHETGIRHLFDLHYLQKTRALSNLLQTIATGASVSLHVRRGDYLTNLHAKQFNGVCNLHYYQQAIQEISNRENRNLQLFIFSDDIDWCKSNLHLKEKHTFINTNSLAHDFFLMSRCRHNIIANSTFSWWAAWLNTHSDKIVVAPGEWHKGLSGNNSDLLPANWITIEQSVDYHT